MSSLIIPLLCSLAVLSGAEVPEFGDGVSTCPGGATTSGCHGHDHSNKGMALLQHGSGSRRTVILDPVDADQELRVNNSETGGLPLCHPSIVQRSCSHINGDAGSQSVTRTQIQVLLATNETTTRRLWASLGLPASANAVACDKLCSAVVEAVRQQGLLPPSSDTGCYSVNGQVSCNVDVNPHRLVTLLKNGGDVRPDQGAKDPGTVDVPEGLVQHAIVATADGIQRLAVTDSVLTQLGKDERHLAGAGGPDRPRRAFCPYRVWETVKLLANFFRIYPADKSDLLISGPADTALLQGGLASVADTIARVNVQAQAWVSQVVVELSSYKTAEYRTEWFGGSGSLSASQVRDRIVMAMNFMDRELGSVRYVYPANSASRSACGSSTVAYVWKFQSNNQGYEETQGPVCGASVDPMTEECALDDQGRYFVYLCELWLESADSWQVGTFVHEAAHHTGPGDVSYDRDVMRGLSQSEQLDNAANYQHFAQAVANAAWGCVDDPQASFPFTCNPGPCRCESLGAYCNMDSVRTQCKGTCGECSGPAPSPTPSPTAAPPAPTPSPPAPTPSPAAPTPSPAAPGPAPTPAPTAAPPSPPGGSPVGCEEETGERDVVIGGTTYRGTCAGFKYYNYCDQAGVAAACPVACGRCLAGTVQQISR